jgi:hypothetical protein
MAVAVTSDATAFKRTANLPTATAYSMWGWFFVGTKPARFWGTLGIGNIDSSVCQISATTSAGASLDIWGNTSNATLITSGNLTTNTWYFMAITKAGTGAGQLIGYYRTLTQNTLSSATAQDSNATMNGAEWGRDGFTGDFMDGRIHACGMCDAVLSPDELLELSFFHEPQLDGIRSLNVFYPTIESVNTNTTVDRSGNARDATATVGALADSPPLLWRATPPPYSLKALAAGGGVTTKTLTDNLTVNDAVFDYLMRVRQQSDTAAVSDQLIYGARRGNITSDGILTSDGVVSGAKRGVVATEPLTVSDANFQYLRRTRQGTDTTDVSDGFVSWRRLVRVSQDNIDVLDGYSRSVTGGGTVYGKVISDTLDVTEGFVSWRRLKRLMADNADILDGFSKTLIGVGIVYAKVMSDVTTLIDDNGQRWTLRTSRLTDSVGLSDAVLRALARIRILGENIEFSDGVIRFLRAVRVSTEDLDISDELVRAYFADQVFNVAVVFGHREEMRMSHSDSMNFSAR